MFQLHKAIQLLILKIAFKSFTSNLNNDLSNLTWFLHYMIQVVFQIYSILHYSKNHMHLEQTFFPNGQIIEKKKPINLNFTKYIEPIYLSMGHKHIMFLYFNTAL